MPEISTQNPNRKATRADPKDQTGRLMEKQKAEQALKVELEAQRMAELQGIQSVKDSAPVDYRDKSRPKVEHTVTVPAEPAVPKEYRVRIVADIEGMTFGKEVIFPGDFSDPANPIMPVMGSLKTYDFKEGREYLVDENLYIHLRDLGYLYE